jgi:type IX secretion system substrate protein
MKSSTLALLILLIFIRLSAQEPDTIWTKKFGGMGNDQTYSVKQTSDGGYILAGQTESFGCGMDDMWLIKTNEMGDTLWTKTYGGSEYDYCYDVEQTSDGGYILFGETYSFHPTFWYSLIVKINSFGDTTWMSVIGEGRHYFARSGIEIAGNNYIFTGRTKASGASQEDLFLVRLNSDGDTVWTKTMGGADDDQGITIDKTDDGNLIIAGVTKSNSAGNYDAWVIKTDANGDTIWTRTYGSTESDLAQDIIQTSDHGYIFVGATRSYGIQNNYHDLWIVKTNALGDTIWTKTFGSNSHCGAFEVQQTPDEGYIIIGYIGLDSFNSDIWLIRLDEFGDTLWTALYGGNGWDIGRSIDLTLDGGYIICGDYYDDVTSSRDSWLIKIATDPTDIQQNDRKPTSENFSLFQNYPNPFNPTTKIKFTIPTSPFNPSPYQGEGNRERLVTLKIYDILGNKITTLVDEAKSPGKYEVEFDGSFISSGVYFYQLRIDDFIDTKKMILLR